MSYFDLMVDGVIKRAAKTRLDFETGMNWNNTKKDTLPKDGEQVLIAVNGIYYLATFHASSGTFKVSEDRDETFFQIDEHQIYWTEFQDPEE